MGTKRNASESKDRLASAAPMGMSTSERRAHEKQKLAAGGVWDAMVEGARAMGPYKSDSAAYRAAQRKNAEVRRKKGRGPRP